MRLLSLVLNSFIQAGTFIYSKKNNEIFKKICINIQNLSPTSVCTDEVTIPSNQIIYCWGQPLPYEPISFKNLTSLGIYHILKVNWTYMPIKKDHSSLRKRLLKNVQERNFVIPKKPRNSENKSGMCFLGHHVIKF